jgi:hypothetical protein
MKYFNAIKNSSHIVAFGYFDRSIEKQAVGEVNPITKKAKERKSVLAEARKLKFRDDAMIADAKSRFSEITDEIDLDADLFIKAIKDAIEAERAKGSGTPAPKTTKKPAPAPVVVKPEEDDEVPFDVDEFADEGDPIEVDFAAMRTEIRNLNKSGTAEQKKAVKAIIASTGMKLDEIEDVSVLTQILEIFE